MTFDTPNKTEWLVSVKPSGRWHRWVPDKVRHAEQVPEHLATEIRLCCEGVKPWPLFIHGEAGSGKTCAALALSDRTDSYYAITSEFVQRMRDAEFGRLYSESGYTVSTLQLWRDWTRPDVAILDEIGTRDRVTDYHYEVIKACLDKREGRPCVYISNHSLKTIAETYDDRVASRLSAGTIVECVGDLRRAAK